MKSIQIFESISLNTNNANVAEINQQLLNFADEVKWAEKNSIQIERFTVEHQPKAFDTNLIVKNHVAEFGKAVLPLTLVAGEVALTGRYPNRAELTKWSQSFQSALKIKPISGCCSGGKCA